MMITVADRSFERSHTGKEDEIADPPKSDVSGTSISTSPISIPTPKHGIHDPAAKILILVCMALIISLGFVYKGSGHMFFSGLWGKMLIMTFKVSMVVFVLTLIWRVVLVLKYRPAPLCPEEKLPTCGVIVPAYNEGRQVLDTLRSIAQSDYPEDRLNIVAVDDGSKDDTWFWIQQAVREMPGRVTPIRLLKNQGKRRALFTGFKHCRSEIFVTIDSDSQVEPQTIRCLVAPFVRNANVGVVAGNVRILNLKEGIIPRMLDVNFAFSFDFLRASQSMVNTVMCSPGALSAYRSDLVRQVLPQWIYQKFLGRPANIGEDRAMTNMILKLGYYVHFQSTAVVYTKAPTGYRGLCKMFLRWARSNIRETLVLTSFVFTRFRKGPMLGARINLVLGLISMTLGQCLTVVVLGWLISSPEIFGIRMLYGSVIAGMLPAAFFVYRYRSSDALWAFAYSLFWVTSLWWIGLYASITPQKTGWLTRDLSPDRTSPLPVSPRPLRKAPVILKKAA